MLAYAICSTNGLPPSPAAASLVVHTIDDYALVEGPVPLPPTPPGWRVVSSGSGLLSAVYLDPPGQAEQLENTFALAVVRD